MADLDYYLEHADEFSTLSDEDKTRLFAGESIEGDTKPEEKPAEESSDTPAAAEEKREAPPAQEAEQAKEAPVVLSRDGKHTIPFEELETARNQAKEWERIAQERATLLESMKTPEPPKAEIKAFDLEAKEREFLDALYDTDKGEAAAVAIRKEINEYLQKSAEDRAVSRVTKAMEERDAQRAEQAAAAALEQVATEAVKAFPFLNSESSDANPTAINIVVALRNDYIAKGASPAEALAQAAGQVGPLFAPKAETKPADAAAKAAEAVARIKPKTPTSLSEVPAGAAAPHDEAAAMREMSGLSLMNKFAGKSPEQIMELMSRVI